jgi:CheY-like chemotaxis protein
MGGEITLESVPGQGSTFRVRLMLAAVSRPTPLAIRNIQGYTGARRTVMVVDDDRDHQALMRAILEPLGFAVIAARDGATCLGLADDVRPDLFIIDISMPGISGWDLARALRSKAVTAPILMLSANVGESSPDRDGAHRGEAHDAVLAKPFDLARLFDRLEALLGIDWIEADASALPEPERPDRMVHPGPDALGELLRLGAIGYVRAIETRLDDLARDPQHRALVQLLRGHLEAFDFAGYAAVIEGLMTDEAAS